MGKIFFVAGRGSGGLDWEVMICRFGTKSLNICSKMLQRWPRSS